MNLYRNLLANTVYVFGSNLAGQHIDETAKFAATHYGSELGIVEGPTGKSYALPVKDEHFNCLPIGDIQWHIEQLLAYARTQRDARFQITRIGCGLNEFKDDQMAPMFKKASDNCFLPGRWLLLNRQLDRVRVFVEGSDTFSSERIEKTLNECIAPFGSRVEVITTGVGAFNDIVRSWARRKDLPWTPFLADSLKFNDLASTILDDQLSWYCTHSIIYQNNVDSSLSRRLGVLQKEGLKVRHFRE